METKFGEVALTGSKSGKETYEMFTWPTELLALNERLILPLNEKEVIEWVRETRTMTIKAKVELGIE